MALTEPIDANFGEDGNRDLDKFVFENLTALLNSYDSLHKSKVQKWRRITKGKPSQESRDFPWPGASNVVVQLVGENVDTIKAIQLGTIYEILPLWVAGLIGEWATNERGEEQRVAVESFMNHMGMSRDELDLYRVESKAAYDIASLGSAVIKLPWVNLVEQVITGIDSTSSKSNPKYLEDEIEIYDGPRPEKLAYEDWGATPTAQTWETADFKYHEYRITKQQCEYKVSKGLFDKDAWEAMKESPDILGLTEEEQEKAAAQNLESPYPDKELARWRFYECWFKYFTNKKTYHIVYTIHLDPKKRMKAFFNFYPKNEEPWEFGRLGYNEDGLIGYGFAEMGEMYQEEVSTTHNQRVDNGTLCNTSVLFGGNNPRIDSGISLFPMAVLPLHPDEAEIKQLGMAAPDSGANEILTLSLAKARFGTDMVSAEGSGSGSVNKKGGYSSMGTFSVMQQGARRINVNITDFRYLHLNVGRKALYEYASFGIGEKRLKYFGSQAPYIQAAMKAIKEGRLELPIKAATASINKEIEKQTGMLFTQVMQRHYGGIAQILQGITNPMIDKDMKEYLIGTVAGMSYIMSKLLRAFGYDDITRMQPELTVVKKLQEKSEQEKQGANNGQQSVPTSQETTTGSDGRSGVPEAAGEATNNNGTPGTSGTANAGGVLLQ